MQCSQELSVCFPQFQVCDIVSCMLQVHVPPSCMLDGVHSAHFFGTGVIVHHSENMGLAVVDRNTVAVSACDVMLSFAAFPIEIPGEVSLSMQNCISILGFVEPVLLSQVVFLHPVHNYALVAYDPSALGAGASIVRAAELLPGQSTYLYL